MELNNSVLAEVRNSCLNYNSFPCGKIKQKGEKEEEKSAK